jgi:hypothetical protein
MSFSDADISTQKCSYQTELIYQKEFKKGQEV